MNIYIYIYPYIIAKFLCNEYLTYCDDRPCRSRFPVSVMYVLYVLHVYIVLYSTVHYNMMFVSYISHETYRFDTSLVYSIDTQIDICIYINVSFLCDLKGGLGLDYYMGGLAITTLGPKLPRHGSSGLPSHASLLDPLPLAHI
jgi:hypothetical protein